MVVDCGQNKAKSSKGENCGKYRAISRIKGGQEM